MEDLESLYPEKPELLKRERKSNLALTVFSVLLFILSFALVFDANYFFILLLVVVLIIHELGHFSLMKLFKYEEVKMLFVPLMGAFVQGKKEVYSQKQSLLVILAGPIPGIVAGTFLLISGTNLESSFMVSTGFLFIGLNLLNLLPLDPLDGGQLLKSLFHGSQEIFQLVFALISSLVLIGVGWYFQEWIMVGFGFFLGIRVKSIHKRYLLRKELKECDVNYISSYKDLSNKAFSDIKRVVLENTKSLQVYQQEVPEERFNALIAMQVNEVLIAPTTKDASALFKIVVILTWLGAIGASIYAVLYTINNGTEGLLDYGF